MKEIQNTMGGCKPSCGSMYPLLEELSTEKLVTLTIEGRKKVYALTEKGKTEFKRLLTEKNKLIDNINELWKVFDSISVKSNVYDLYSHYMEDVLNNIKKGDLPFKEISPEILQFRLNIMRLSHDKKIPKYKNELKHIFYEINSKLKKLT